MHRASPYPLVDPTRRLPPFVRLQPAHVAYFSSSTASTRRCIRLLWWPRPTSRFSFRCVISLQTCVIANCVRAMARVRSIYDCPSNILSLDRRYVSHTRRLVLVYDTWYGRGKNKNFHFGAIRLRRSSIVLGAVSEHACENVIQTGSDIS